MGNVIGICSTNIGHMCHISKIYERAVSPYVHEHLLRNDILHLS